MSFAGKSHARGAIVLSGGGARGAYQAGVLRGLAEIAARHPKLDYFRIISGVSSGAVNGTYLAANAQDPLKATEGLCQIWTSLKPEQVFRSDNLWLLINGSRVLRKLIFGGVRGGSSRGRANQEQVSLLDTRPARELFGTKINYEGISQNIASGYLDYLALTATDYQSSFGVTFIEGLASFQTWERADRFSVKTKIQVEHVMASSAIPIFFPAAKIGERFFGDGCLRNTAPLSPVIRLGASKLVVVGVRKGLGALPKLDDVAPSPGIGKILNTIINAILMDGMEMDMERLVRVNQAIRSSGRTTIPAGERDLRLIEVFHIHPSRDIGELAQRYRSRLPFGIRYLLSGLGDAKETADILSYLLFDGDYCAELVALGREDCLAQESALLAAMLES